MKWSYPYGTPDTRGALLGARGDAQKVFDSLAQFGYSGVELFVRDPAAFDHAEVFKALEASGLQVAAIGTGPIVTDDQLTLSAADAGVRSRAIARAKATVELAADFRSQVNIGKLRGTLGPDPESSWGYIREGLVAVADYATTVGAIITLEPQCSGVIDNLNSTQETIDFIAGLAHPNIKLMVDVYHAELEERWPALSYVRAGQLLAHVHFADSGRRTPGRGDIDFRLHLATLDAINYDGYITVEISQGDDALVTANEAVDFLSSLSF
jgi:5-keto-L-gluconate epimerase